MVWLAYKWMQMSYKKDVTPLRRKSKVQCGKKDDIPDYTRDVINLKMIASNEAAKISLKAGDLKPWSILLDKKPVRDLRCNERRKMDFLGWEDIYVESLMSTRFLGIWTFVSTGLYGTIKRCKRPPAS